MQISTKLADNIVNEMKLILKHEINFMSTDYQIIASTDTNRIGDIHEGSKLVIQSGEALLVEFDNQYAGTKKGMNVPIFFKDMIIGVIGVTGEKNEVTQYSSILRKMTEILIKEQYLKDAAFNRREYHSRIIDSLLYPETEFNFLLTQDRLITFKSKADKVAILGKIKDFTSDYDSHTLFTFLEQHFRNESGSLFSVKQDTLYLVMTCFSKTDLQKKLKTLAHHFKLQLQGTMIFGIGTVSDSMESLSDSFKEATEALNWSLRYSASTFSFFDDLDLALLLNHTSDSAKKDYQRRLLSSIPEEEFDELKAIVLAYGEYDRSITKTADRFFLHKNTVQYKLNKIKDYTAYNPRVLNEYVVLYLAFLISESSD